MMKHRGLSLIEVIIALAILVGSAAALTQLVDVGRRHAERAVEVTDVQSICRNVMNEVLAGVRPWEEVRRQPVDPFTPWDCSIEIRPTDLVDLFSVTVAVMEPAGPGSNPLAMDEVDNSSRQYRLVRWVRRPIQESAEFNESNFENNAGGRFDVP